MESQSVIIQEAGIDEQSNIQIHSLEAQKLPMKSVIVYADRAEVKRILKIDASAGKNCIIINNVSSVIESQSLRVEGDKVAKILEVFYEESPLSTTGNEETTSETAKILNDFENERSDLETTRSVLEDQIHVLRKRLEVLDGVAGQIGQNVLVSSDIEVARKQSISSAASAFLLCDDAMKNLTSFLDYYGNTASKMKQELRDKETELLCIKRKIGTLDRDLDRQRCKFEYDNHKRNINIMIEVENSGTVEVYVSYQENEFLVYCATWRPCYDIRASTSTDSFDANNCENNGVSIYYYGLIEQKTDENWKDAEIVLSMAVPAFSGVVPTLPTLTASFQRQQILFRNQSQRCRKPPMSHGSQEEDIGIGSYDYNDFADAAAFHRVNVTQRTSSDNDLAQMPEHMPSTYFPIEEKATVLSNGHYHKVTIAKIKLDSIFLHETVPSRTASAFVSITATNSSSLPLLPGLASIFLNNSFISTQHLKAIMPGEEFRCLLGIDQSVKIEYKPALKHNEQVGFMSKSLLCTHEQIISLQNSKIGTNVRITVREPIPKSIDDKIRITVISPELKNNRAVDARLSKENCLEWVCVLSPGEQKDLLVKWTTEFPVNENVVYTSINSNAISN